MAFGFGVSPPQLGTELGYAQITSNFTTASGTAVDVTGLSVTVTIGSRPVVVEFACAYLSNNAAGGGASISIVDSTASATIGSCAFVQTAASEAAPGYCRARVNPAAGSRTYKVQLNRLAGVGTCAINAASTFPASLQVTEV